MAKWDKFVRALLLKKKLMAAAQLILSAPISKKVINDPFSQGAGMSTVSLKDAKASFSHVIDQAAAGEFVTITRHGRAAAVLVSVGAAEAARKALRKDRPSLVQYLKTFPADLDLDDDVFARNPAPSREVDL